MVVQLRPLTNFPSGIVQQIDFTMFNLCFLLLHSLILMVLFSLIFLFCGYGTKETALVIAEQSVCQGHLRVSCHFAVFLKGKISFFKCDHANAYSYPSSDGVRGSVDLVYCCMC